VQTNLQLLGRVIKIKTCVDNNILQSGDKLTNRIEKTIYLKRTWTWRFWSSTGTSMERRKTSERGGCLCMCM